MPCSWSRLRMKTPREWDMGSSFRDHSSSARVPATAHPFRWCPRRARPKPGRCKRIDAAAWRRPHLSALPAALAAALALPLLGAAAAAAGLLLAALLRGARRVGDLGGALLAHALLAQTLVLLVVLDAGSVVLGHVHHLLGGAGWIPAHGGPKPPAPFPCLAAGVSTGHDEQGGRRHRRLGRCRPGCGKGLRRTMRSSRAGGPRR